MSTIKADTLQNLAGSKSVPTSTVVDGTAKAWVNFNGTGTVAIRAAFNVSSITDNGVSLYTVNFTTPFADANYAVAQNVVQLSNGTNITSTASQSYGVNGFQIVQGATGGGGGGNVDNGACHAAVYR